MTPKRKVLLSGSPETILIWTDDIVQLLWESLSNFKMQKGGKWIDWQSVKEKYEKIKGTLRDNLRRQLNENEFPHSAHISPFLSNTKVFLCSSEVANVSDTWIVLFLWNEKTFSRYFQPRPLSEVPTIRNLRHAAGRTRTWTEPEFRFCRMKLCSSDNLS